MSILTLLDRVLRYLNLKRVKPCEVLVLAPRLTGTWVQSKDEDTSVVVGYQHTCLCGEEKKYSAAEAHAQKIHTCNCGRKFSLMHSLVPVSADGKIDPAEYALCLSHLSTKIVKSAKPEPPRMQAVGDEPLKVAWLGRQDTARDRAFNETGDPGYTGLF